MADFNQPTLTTLYTTVLSELKARDVDSISLIETPTNPPTGAIRYNRALNKFQEWNGTAWVDKVISIAGGGTGASDPAGIRSGLGLGSMALQNSNAVAITGGVISGLSALTVSGDTALSGRLDVGSSAVNAIDVTGGIRAGSGNVDIIGTDGRIPAISPTYFASQTIAGSWTFTGTVNLQIVNVEAVVITSANPQVIFFEPGAPVNEKYYRIISGAGNINIQGFDDGFASGLSYLTIYRTGINMDQVTVHGNLAAAGNLSAGGTLVIVGSQNLGGITTAVNIQTGSLTASGTIVANGYFHSALYQSPANLQIQVPLANTITLNALGTTGFKVTKDGFTYIDDATGVGGFNFTIADHGFGAADRAFVAAQPGPFVYVGRNTTSPGAPATLRLMSRGGALHMIWVDESGRLRIANGLVPVGPGGDAVGVVVGTQS